MKTPILIYNKNERWGILTLVMLNLVLFLISFTFSSPDYQFDEQKLLAFQESVNSQPSQKASSPIDSLYTFNPNTASYESLLALGFSQRVAKNIIKYRSKGGRFYNAQSVRKIYGMDSVFFEKIASFIDIPQQVFSTKYPQKRKAKQVSIPLKSFPFDPNTATQAQLLSLGFSKRLAQNIINYRSKGGHFYKPESLKKIYGMTDEFYAAISSNIRIKKQGISAKPKGSSLDKSPKSDKPIHQVWPKGKKLAINTATVEDWDKLPGIGRYYAKNIVRLRERLGGFYAVRQVAEAYRLPDSTFQKIVPFLQVDPSKIKKFNPQTADFKTINRHPYITYEQTKQIMRAQKGIHLRAKDDFLVVKIFTEEELERVLPYFVFE